MISQTRFWAPPNRHQPLPVIGALPRVIGALLRVLRALLRVVGAPTCGFCGTTAVLGGRAPTTRRGPKALLCGWFGQAGVPCAPEGGYGCTPDRRNLTVCRGGRTAIASTCRGVRGCSVGNAVDCNHSVALVGDPCDGPNEIACAQDGKALLRCSSGVYQFGEACRNACLSIRRHTSPDADACRPARARTKELVDEHVAFERAARRRGAHRKGARRRRATRLAVEALIGRALDDDALRGSPSRRSSEGRSTTTRYAARRCPSCHGHATAPRALSTREAVMSWTHDGPPGLVDTRGRGGGASARRPSQRRETLDRRTQKPWPWPWS